MRIPVHAMSGELVAELDVEASDHVSKLKDAVVARAGKPRAWHSLVMDSTILEDDATIEDCGISAGSTLQLIVQAPISILCFAGGFARRVEVMPNSTIASLRDAGRMPGPEVVGDWFFRGQRLSDLRTLASYGVQNDSAIHAAADPWHDAPDHAIIVVRLNFNVGLNFNMRRQGVQCTSHSVLVSESDTIADVKRKVSDRERKTSAGEQPAFFQGKELEDSCTLADCGISMHDTIMMPHAGGGGGLFNFLEEKFFVKTPSGKVIRTVVRGRLQEDDLKAWVEVWDGVPKWQQRVLHDGDDLYDVDSICLDEATLSVQHLEHNMPIRVRVGWGKHHTSHEGHILGVAPSDTVAMVAQSYYRHVSASRKGSGSFDWNLLRQAKQFRLLLGQKHLQADQTLASYGVWAGCTIQVFRVGGPKAKTKGERRDETVFDIESLRRAGMKSSRGIATLEEDHEHDDST